MTYNLELILTALKNTKTVEGAKKAIAQVEAIYESEIEGSFFEPQIHAELQRLKELIKKNNTSTC
ncbi:MAG: hypothetical protein NWF09_07545 [Candidatus Bathyarchaeota archaeon]|nr:hypothetical protein [Candidatus Bathyarchaeota archaeon]